MQLIVGRVAKPHGVRGEVIVDIRTDEPEARFVAGAVYATEVPRVRRGSAPATSAPGKASAPDKTTAPGSAAGAAVGQSDHGVAVQVPPTLRLTDFRWHQGRLIAQFEGYADRDVAEVLRGVLLCVDSATVAPPDDPDEFNDHQLLGLSVVSVDGEILGEVARIEHAPASDLIVLRRPDGGTALIPFVRAIVPTVDLAAGRVIVDPPGGLFDL